MFRPLAAACAVALPLSAAAQERPQWRVELEAGGAFQSRNEVRVPGRGGTDFDMNRLQGDPVLPLVRATLGWDPWERHGFRLTYQYLRGEGTGTLPGPTAFANAAYAPGVATTGNYRFDTWRLTYRYAFWQTEALTMRIGVTGLIRDAEIRLRQAGVTSRKSDVGFVPLLHASFDWRFAPAWTLIGEIDALGASQGRAIDAGLRVARDIAPRWQASLGWRVLDGGVDNDDVRNFARFHSVTAGLSYRF